MFTLSFEIIPTCRFTLRWFSRVCQKSPEKNMKNGPCIFWKPLNTTRRTRTNKDKAGAWWRTMTKQVVGRLATQWTSPKYEHSMWLKRQFLWSPPGSSYRICFGYPWIFVIKSVITSPHRVWKFSYLWPSCKAGLRRLQQVSYSYGRGHCELAQNMFSICPKRDGRNVPISVYHCWKMLAQNRFISIAPSNIKLKIILFPYFPDRVSPRLW